MSNYTSLAKKFDNKVHNIKYAMEKKREELAKYIKINPNNLTISA